MTPGPDDYDPWLDQPDLTLVRSPIGQLHIAMITKLAEFFDHVPKHVQRALRNHRNGVKTKCSAKELLERMENRIKAEQSFLMDPESLFPLSCALLFPVTDQHEDDMRETLMSKGDRALLVVRDGMRRLKKEK